MKNPYLLSANLHHEAIKHQAYEQCRQDAIKVVEGVKNPYLIKSRHNGFEYARSAIIAALSPNVQGAVKSE